jgi:hypothetical protein
MNIVEVNEYTQVQILTPTQFIIDFGLVVLIWIVQLIIYPSFLYYQKINLINWHKKYTKKIAIIVVPLMLLQLVFAIFQMFYQLNTSNVITLIIVLFLWGFTFTSFAPIHFKISSGKHTQKDLYLLIKRNWWRTFLWTALFIFDVLK